MVQYDAHMHTQFSTDSEEPMENMIRESIRRKLCGITFTDHMDYRFPVTYDWKLGKGEKPFQFDFEKYRETIAVLREKYKEQIEIHTGVEIGLKSDAYEENVALSKRCDLEYCIGSIHLVENMDPYYPDFWESYGEENGLKRYFETTYEQLKNLGEIRIDTVGHLDYITRYLPSGYAFYHYEKYAELIDEILKIILERNIILEINTSGYKNDGIMPNPCFEIIKRFRELGGENIIFGSDAHDISRVAADFDRAAMLAQKAGFSGCVSVKDHVRQFHSF